MQALRKTAWKIGEKISVTRRVEEFSVLSQTKRQHALARTPTQVGV